MADDTSDEALMARLHRLKTEKLSAGEPLPHDTAASSLQARFAKLGAKNLSTEKIHDYQNEVFSGNFEDEKLLDELMSDVGSQEQWTLHPAEINDVSALIREAKDALNQSSNPNDEAISFRGSNLLRQDAIVEKNTEMQAEEDEATEIVSQALAEADMDRKHSSDAEEDPPSTIGVNLILPSAPSELRDANKRSVENEDMNPDEDLASRLSGLSLPTAPSFAPISRPVKVIKSNLPQFTNEEIDSWCVICNDDASLKCLGCDEDLYCVNCWNEGHRGPDAGFEEKRHKAVQYTFKKRAVNT